MQARSDTNALEYKAGASKFSTECFSTVTF